MEYKTLNLDEKSFDIISKHSKKFKQKKGYLVARYLEFFEENLDLINADFFQKSENMDEK